MRCVRSRLFWISIILVMSLTALGHPAAAKDQPPTDPILRIEPGMHTAPLFGIDVDRNCRLMATSSDDKTVRLWSLTDIQNGAPKLLRTLRPPIGPGNDGKLYAVALSPDGKWVAAGGWDATWRKHKNMYVYIFEAETGRLVTRLGKLGNAILHLAFSPDGRALAATLSGGKGVRVWKTKGWRLVGEDRDYGGQRSSGVVFDKLGRLFTVSYDGHLRRYGLDLNRGGGLKLQAKYKTLGGNRPYSVAVHPKGDRVAVGYADKRAVDIYDAKTLKRLFAANTKGVANGDMIAVAWSADGTRLYGGGRWQVSGRSPLRVWTKAGRGPYRDLKGPHDTIFSLRPCGPDLALGAADPAFGLIAADGRRRIWRDTVTPDMRRKRFGDFTISETGRRVRFGLKYGRKEPVLFDLTAERLITAKDALGDLYAADTKSLNIASWQDNRRPTLNGQPITLKNFEEARSLAIAPDKQRFVLGIDRSLRAYDKDGKTLWKPKAGPGVVWGVNISRDAKLIVAAYGDGTIRWHRLSDGEELLALFVHAKTRKWVAWTPKGYYIASPGGESLIGWHVNRGWDKAADFFPADRFRKRFYRPDIVKRVLETLDEEKAVTQANRIAKRRRGDEDLRKSLPPVIKILGPATDSKFSGSSLTVEYSLRSPSGLPVKKVEIFVDGRPLEARGFVPQQSDQTARISVPLPPRNVTIALVARTANAASSPATLALKWTGRTRTATPDYLKPRLYALLVGVSKYGDTSLVLNYAAKDARDFNRVLKAQQGGLYREVITKVLTDENAKRGDILDGLEWLEQEVTARDVGVLFLSGHGITDNKQRFYYLPVDGNPKRLKSTGVKQSDIQDTLASLPGKILMFIDACQSARGLTRTKTKGAPRMAAADMTGIINELTSAENGVVMFSSSTGRELSVESHEWKNGAFTKALVEGWSGMADYSKDGAISIAELDLWISDRVKVLTQKAQHPVAVRPDTIPDFPVALAGR